MMSLHRRQCCCCVFPLLHFANDYGLTDSKRRETLRVQVDANFSIAITFHKHHYREHC